MHTINLRKYIGVLAFCLAFTFSFAQSKYDGDMLINMLGKSSQSADFNNLKTGYNFKVANEGHYLSTEGIELVLQNSVLNEIRLYKDSPVYGSFKGKLPKGLAFGLTVVEVKKILGKPSVTYSNTGYSEFIVEGQVISCWFDKDRLSQVDLGTK